jgi:anaerobic magnesium-protoporphyrin IX monomethyl ester cyclase
MRALLILPSFRGYRFGREWRKNPTVTPPLGLLYVGGALERAGFSVRILDLNVEQVAHAEFLRLVREADLVGVSVFTLNQGGARAVIEDVRGVNPRARIVCGGPHVNCVREPFPGADLTFVGEAEETAGSVCGHLVRSELKALRTFRGLLFFDCGELVRTGPPAIVRNLDGAPRPARHLVEASRYGELIGIPLSCRIDAITTSRGCPCRCSFCVRRGMFHYRQRSAADVVEEIEEIARSGADLLVFNEDNFVGDPERALEIMRHVTRRRIRLKLLLQARVDALNEELMRAFRDAGVLALILGIESGTQEILDYYRKGTTVEQAQEAVELADRLGIFTYGFFILGAPPERRRHLDENLAFMTRIPLDFVGFNILDFQFGSALWSRMFREGVVSRDELVVPTGPRFGALPYPELEWHLRRSYRRFYLRPGHHLRVMGKCMRTWDFTLFVFALRLAAKLIGRFRTFALTEEAPRGATVVKET